MAAKIRLARAGSKKRPYYHIVIADVRAPRDGRFIERVGRWNPMLAKDGEAKRVELNEERIKHWLAAGAIPTDRVLRFLADAGLASRPAANNPKKGEPGKAAQQRIAEKAQKEIDAKAALEAAKQAEADAKAAAAEEAKAAAEAAAAEAAAAKQAEAEAKAAAEAAPAAEVAASDEAFPFVDAIILLDGVGEKTTEALAAEGVTKLSQILDMSDEDLAALSEKVGAGDQWQSKEWKIQAQEMKDGKGPRAKVDQETARKMAAEA